MCRRGFLARHRTECFRAPSSPFPPSPDAVPSKWNRLFAYFTSENASRPIESGIRPVSGVKYWGYSSEFLAIRNCGLYWDRLRISTDFCPLYLFFRRQFAGADEMARALGRLDVFEVRVVVVSATSFSVTLMVVAG